MCGLEHEKRTLFKITLLTGIASILPISCLIIASNYNADSSTCGLKDDCIIPLSKFLNVIGYGSIMYILCMVLIQLKLLHAKVSKHSAPKTNACNSRLQILGGLWFTFLVIWVGIGLYIYHNQMSDECQKESIATMIFVCCITISIFAGIGLCIFACLLYVAHNWEMDTFYTY